MIKIQTLTFFLAISKVLSAQSITEDDILALLKDSTGATSSLVVSVGAGNGVFSKKNNSLNADQESLSKIFYTTTVDYYHKSGFGLTLNSFFIPLGGSIRFYQADITPSYYYGNEKIYTGVSYTRFFAAKNSTIAVNPFKNGVNGSFKWLKSWIRPGVQLQYSNGNNNEVFDTSFTLNLPVQPRVIRIVDSISSKINDFTISFSGDHKFNFGKLFSKNDELSFVPAISLNAGVSKSSTTSTANVSFTRKRKQPLANIKRSKTGNDYLPFALQSIALSTDFYYTIGKFFVEPQVYADYYLPATDTKRLATVFSLNVGIGF
ncbi:MAG: hypothetical protein ACKVOM_10365 [Ferruginibacter sp.]